MVSKIEDSFDKFLKDPDVIEVMGPVNIVQTMNVVEEMRNNCKSQFELDILNDKILKYLTEIYKLRKYE